MPVRNSQSGMSLVAVMIATAIMSSVAVMIMALFGGLGKTTVRENIEARQDSVMRYVRVMLAQPDICSYALRAGAFNAAGTGPNLPFDFVGGGGNAETTIGHLQVRRNGTGAATLGLTAGQLSPSLRIDRIYLRTPKPSLGEIPAKVWILSRNYQSPSQGAPSVQVFDATTAKLVVRFAVTGQEVLGPPVRELTADITVAVDRIAGEKYVVYCSTPQTAQSINMQCAVAADLYPGRATCPSAAGNCAPVYYINGFDPLGVPLCYCATNCTVN